MKTEDFRYDLPEELIALRPMEPREAARLLCVDRQGGVSDHLVGDLPSLLRAGDVMVFNNTRVLPASLTAMRPARDAQGRDVSAEVLLHRDVSDTPDVARWTCLLKPARRLKSGDVLVFSDTLRAIVEARGEGGEATLAFDCRADALLDAIAEIGATPLPPYIAARRAPDAQDRADYQTVFAREAGSVAAPTAGLHFTEKLLQAMEDAGVERVEVTLHVGLGTFLPVKVDNIDDHRMHAERYEVREAAAATINRALDEGRRIIAVGTTAMRTLETVGRSGRVVAGHGDTAIFIRPGFDFQVCGGLWTNFHLPESTLLMLVSAFCGVEVMRRAYAHAVAARYRFFSYGDASLLWKAAR